MFSLHWFHVQEQVLIGSAASIGAALRLFEASGTPYKVKCVDGSKVVDPKGLGLVGPDWYRFWVRDDGRTLTGRALTENICADLSDCTRPAVPGSRFCGRHDAEAKRSAAIPGLQKLLEDTYNGIPLALVEMWPTVGDIIVDNPVHGPDGSLDLERSGEYWTVYSTGPDGICAKWVGGQERHASMRHSSTRDGLFWLVEGGEKDGYALHLVLDGKEPGKRSWRLDRNTRVPELHNIETVSRVDIQGPTYGRS